MKIEEIKISVVDKQTLIELKTDAGRDIDLRDIKNLKENMNIYERRLANANRILLFFVNCI